MKGVGHVWREVVSCRVLRLLILASAFFLLARIRCQSCRASDRQIDFASGGRGSVFSGGRRGSILLGSFRLAVQCPTAFRPLGKTGIQFQRLRERAGWQQGC
jgi:hypothetical protein